jgi:hypothetical protein
MSSRCTFSWRNLPHRIGSKAFSQRESRNPAWYESCFGIALGRASARQN